MNRRPAHVQFLEGPGRGLPEPAGRRLLKPPGKDVLEKPDVGDGIGGEARVKTRVGLEEAERVVDGGAREGSWFRPDTCVEVGACRGRPVFGSSHVRVR